MDELNLDKLLESTRRKQERNKKRKMGNRSRVWTKDAVARHTIEVGDDEWIKGKLVGED